MIIARVQKKIRTRARRYNGWATLFLCLALLGQAGPLCAEGSLATSLDPELAAKLRQPGDIVLEDISLAQAMFAINETWDINIVVSSNVEGQITGIFRDAPLYEILDSILLANGYGYRPLGKSLVIMPLEGQVDLNPMFETVTIALRAAGPAELLSGAKLLSSPRGHVEAIPSARSLLVIDFPDRVAIIRRFAEQIDNATLASGSPTGAENGSRLLPPEVTYFAPQFVDAIELKEAVQSLLSPEGRVSVVEPENRLVVYDFPQHLALVEDLILQLDIPRPQVRITSVIYDVSLGDMERIGLNWNHALRGGETNADGNPALLWAIDSLQQVPAVAGLPGATMTLATMNQDFDLTAAVQLLRQCDDSRLLADPSVVVIDREPALMQIVTEIPFQQLTQTSQGGSIGSTGFREAGVTLNVTPYISNDATILMDVRPSFSRLAGFTTGDSPQPIIDRREAQTMVRVRDGRTFVLGGLRQRTEVGTFRRVPGLGDINRFGIGKLFRSREETVRESELIVFIRPEIVTPDYPGNQREVSAVLASDCLLERIPYASQDPCTWGCNGRTDPGCCFTNTPSPCSGTSYSGGCRCQNEGYYEEIPPAPVQYEVIGSADQGVLAPAYQAQRPSPMAWNNPGGEPRATTTDRSVATTPSLIRLPGTIEGNSYQERQRHVATRDTTVPWHSDSGKERIGPAVDAPSESRTASQWIDGMIGFR